MEIETIEKKTLDEMLEKLNVLKNFVKTTCGQRKVQGMDKWLDSQEVCLILNISPRTLKTYRETGKIGFSQINYKIYYKYNEITRFLNSHIKNINNGANNKKG